jgi:predicted RecB family nuclease
LDFEATAAANKPAVDVLEKRDAPIEQRIKTAADHYQLQMQAYALALRELLPANIPLHFLRATLHFIDPNVEVAVAADLLDRVSCVNAIDDAMNTIATLDGTLDADQFPPLPATHCRMCNFQDLCPAGREWLRGAVAQP